MKKIVFLVLAAAIVSISWADAVGAVSINWVQKPDSPIWMNFHYGGVIGSMWYHAGGSTYGNVGQTTSQAYDLVGNQWLPMASMNKPHRGHGVVAYGGKLYVFGGISYWNVFHPELEVYDPGLDSWSYLAPMPVAIRYFGYAISGDRIYVAGGESSSFVPLNSLWVYDIGGNTWSAGPPMPTTRLSHCSAAYGGKIYTFGGYDASYNATNLVQVYNIASGTWSTEPSIMPIPTIYSGATVLGNKIYVVGGQNASGSLKTVQVYDPATQTWKLGTDLPVAGTQAAVDAYNGKLYVYFAGSTYEGTLGTPPPEPEQVEVFFDDFKYDVNLTGQLTEKGEADFRAFGWSRKTGHDGPGDPCAIWLSENVLFHNGEDDPGIVRLYASTDGNPENTTQSEVNTPEGFFEGTYAAHVYFTDTPQLNRDGTVQAFYSMSDWEKTCGTPNYSECDFEYLAYDIWAFPQWTLLDPLWFDPGLYVSTWEFVQCNGDWQSSDRLPNRHNGSLDGWHTLVFTVNAGVVRYYLDGGSEPVGSHDGEYYPERNMAIRFNHWFNLNGYGPDVHERTYVFAVDWVLHVKDKVLNTSEVESLVQEYRDRNIPRETTISCFALSPVEIAVTDPLGRITNSSQTGIPESRYLLVDQDGDGDTDPTVILYEPMDGPYLIYAIPLPDAEPNETYSLYVNSWFDSVSLVNDSPVSDIPPEGFRVAVTGNDVLVLNIPPAADAGDDQSAFVGSNCLAQVTLDGSDSNDPEGDALSYSWTWTIDSETHEANGANPTIELPLGVHNITLIVNDGIEDSQPDEVVITVLDNIPPEFALSVTPAILWPPNHKMVQITPSWTVSDNCDESVEVTLISITMNEGDETSTYDPSYDDTTGDGNTTDDIQVDSDGSIYLRAERSGKGDGRVYTITYRAVDNSGNYVDQSATVTVPHDQS